MFSPLLHVADSPHLPVSLEIAFAVLVLGTIVFALVVYDLARRYEYPTDRSGESWP